jgi:hypothetical protein
VSCKRCAKAGRACITTPPTRKRQKKADSRVAELERKIDALTATLHAQKSGTPEVRHTASIPQHEPNSADGAPPGSYPLSQNAQFGHEWGDSAPSGYAAAPPGYGVAPTFQRGPDAKRRKLDADSHADSHAVSSPPTTLWLY